MTTTDSAESPADQPPKAPPVAVKPAGKKLATTGAVAPAVSAVEPSLKNLLPTDAQTEDPDQQQEPGFHHASGFWNQPWVQNILPLSSSILLHITIIAIGILFFNYAPRFINPNKEQVIIPESKPMEKNAMPGGIEHPGLNNDNTRDAMQDVTKNTDNKGFSTEVSNNLSPAGSGTEDAGAFEGSSTSAGKGINGLSGGSGGGTAPWGVPGGGGGGLLPKSNFFGVGGPANKIIYLCDKSGSMLSVFGALKQQLKQSVHQLDVADGQQFNIIFFSDEGADALFKDGMHLATPDALKKADDYIDDEVASGGTLPLPAIKMAMQEKPELLYVLTDGFDQIASFDEVVNAFRDGNPDGKMHINCIFLQSDEDPKLEEILKRISTQGHGDFKKILKSDM